MCQRIYFYQKILSRKESRSASTNKKLSDFKCFKPSIIKISPLSKFSITADIFLIHQNLNPHHNQQIFLEV